MFCGRVAFLLGVSSFLMCFVVVNRGDVVVDCVVNVVCWLSLLVVLEWDSFLNFILGGYFGAGIG
jgi:hypothetical protein